MKAVVRRPILAAPQ
jgi:hypothetical protein